MSDDTTQISDNPAEFTLDLAIAARLKLNDAGLIPAVVQAVDTREVLMMAWMDTHALAYTQIGRASCRERV